MVKQLLRLGAFGIALLFAAPASALPTEPPAREAAAMVDFRKTCATFIGPYIEHVVNHPEPYYRRTREEAASQADRTLLNERDANSSTHIEVQYRGVLGEEGARVRLRNSQQAEAQNPTPSHRLLKCASEVALRHVLEGVPGYDHGVGAGTSAPAQRPNAAAEPTPQLSTREILFKTISDGDIAGAQALFGSGNVTVATELDDVGDTSLHLAAERCHTQLVSYLLSQGANPNLANKFGDTPIGIARARCGASLPTLAALLSPPPATVPSSSKQQGKDARIIASDGKSAMDCVKLETLGGDSAVSGGGRVLVNRCPGEVEIGWCYSPGDCDTETGSGWTVQPGKSWPVKAEGEVRWAACHGRDTARFVEGSHGLRFYCKGTERAGAKSASVPTAVNRDQDAGPSNIPSSKADADAKFAAELLEYEQGLAAHKKAVADFEAAQRKMAADKAAAAARATTAQEDFARRQAAHQADMNRHAREQEEYEAKLAGRPPSAIKRHAQEQGESEAKLEGRPPSATKLDCLANNTCPLAKKSELRHILKLGSQCISTKMLGTLNSTVEIEVSNDCTTTQLVATYIEVDDFPRPWLVNVHGPGYAEWKGKLPASGFRAVDPYPMAMYPNQRVMFHVSEGSSTTLKTAACNYESREKVPNRLFTDLTLHGFTQYVCPPNPQPEPNPFPFGKPGKD